MATVDLDRVDGLDVLTKLTKRSAQFVNVVFALRVHGKPATTVTVADRFTDCSSHFAASVLHEAADAGALIEDDAGEWHVIPEAVAAMRIYFKGWSDAYSEADEQKGLS